MPLFVANPLSSLVNSRKQYGVPLLICPFTPCNLHSHTFLLHLPVPFILTVITVAFLMCLQSNDRLEQETFHLSARWTAGLSLQNCIPGKAT